MTTRKPKRVIERVIDGKFEKVLISQSLVYQHIKFSKKAGDGHRTRLSQVEHQQQLADFCRTEVILNSDATETSQLSEGASKVGSNDTCQTDQKLSSDSIQADLTALLRHWNGAATLPTELKQLIIIWPRLPEHIKAAVLALVGTVKA